MCFKHNSINNNEFIKIEKFIANIVGADDPVRPALRKHYPNEK